MKKNYVQEKIGKPDKKDFHRDFIFIEKSAANNALLTTFHGGQYIKNSLELWPKIIKKI